MAGLKYIRWLSLHIAMGAICILYFVDRLQELTLPTSAYISLFTAVWAVYLLDHRLDSSKPTIQSQRRQFHRRSRRWIDGLLGINIIAGLISALFLPRPLLVAGCLFAIASAAYLAASGWLARWNSKEFVSAVFYAFGIFLAPLVYGDPLLNATMALQLAALAFVNMVLFSMYEAEMDRLEGFQSIVVNLGRSRSMLLVRFFLLGTFLSLLIGQGTLSVRYEIFIFTGAVLFAALSWLPNVFMPKERYRVVGDLIFIFPLGLLG